jgi:tetratricopeptide (TPR) repeat protein
MRKIFFTTKTLFLLLIFALNVSAQTPQGVDMKKVQEQIKQAQALIKQKMGAADMKKVEDAMQQAREQTKKTGMKNAQGKDITDSAVNAIQMPDPGKTVQNMSDDLNKNMAALQNMQQKTHQAITQGLPQKGTGLFSAVPNAQKLQIVAYAQAMLAAALPKLNQLNPMLKSALDGVLKDTTITPQAQGMMLLATGAPLPAIQYLVCKGVIKQPSNPWAANSLGVLFRADHKYKEAVQCFKYAYWINPCMLIKSNLAWAIAYYGDFSTAKKYFHDVLAIIPDYADAWEGLGMIAYQEGDTATLFQCLASQLKVSGMGGPDSGPSDNFTSFCGGVKMDQEMANIGQSQSNDPPPPANSSGNGDDGDNQDPPPTAGVEYPTFPSMGGIFAQNIDDLMPTLERAPAALANIIAKKKDSQQTVIAIAGGLSKMDERPYTDDQGMKVTPFRYSKFVIQFHGVEAEYAGRLGYVMKEYNTKREKLVLSIIANMTSFNDAYTVALKNAHTDDELKAVNCDFKKRARSEVGSNFSGASALFSEYFVKMKDQVDWFIGESTPFIKRMHKPDWNTYLNEVRRDDMNQAVLNMYESWVQLQGVAAPAALLALMTAPMDCTTTLRLMDGNAEGPKPQEVKFKKFETPPAPCDKMFNTDQKYKYATIHRDCDGTRVAVYPIVVSKSGSIDAGPLKGSAEATAKLGFVMQTIAKNGETRVGTTANVSAEVSIGVAAKDGDKTTNSKAGASAGASATFEGNFDSTIRIDKDGSVIGRAKSGNFDASVKVEAEGSISDPLGAASAKAEWHAQASGSFDAVTSMGSDSSYNLTSSAFAASQGSSSNVKLH